MVKTVKTQHTTSQKTTNQRATTGGKAPRSFKWQTVIKLYRIKGKKGKETYSTEAPTNPKNTQKAAFKKPQPPTKVVKKSKTEDDLKRSQQHADNTKV